MLERNVFTCGDRSEFRQGNFIGGTSAYASRLGHRLESHVIWHLFSLVSGHVNAFHRFVFLFLECIQGSCLDWITVIWVWNIDYLVLLLKWFVQRSRIKLNFFFGKLNGLFLVRIWFSEIIALSDEIEFFLLPFFDYPFQFLIQWFLLFIYGPTDHRVSRAKQTHLYFLFFLFGPQYRVLQPHLDTIKRPPNTFYIVFLELFILMMFQVVNIFYWIYVFEFASWHFRHHFKDSVHLY